MAHRTKINRTEWEKNHLSNLNTQVQIDKIEWMVWFFAKLFLGM